jgi:hypothetical protein
LVGIECDGRTYHSGATARDRDRLRQHILEGLGWRIHRIWSTDWWLNPEGEIVKVMARLQTILDESEKIDEEPPVEVQPEAVSESIETAEVSEVKFAPSVSPEPVKEDSTPIYTPVTLNSNSPEDFYEPGIAWQLSGQLEDVINAEGPISEAVLFRKVARAWGLERTGSRIVERLKGLVPRSIGRTREGALTFYWPQSLDATGLCPIRIADEATMSKRHVDDVSQEELAALVLHVLEQAGGSPRQDAAKAVCRLIGMARITADSEARVSRAIDQLVKNAQVLETDANIRIPA